MEEDEPDDSSRVVIPYLSNEAYKAAVAFAVRNCRSWEDFSREYFGNNIDETQPPVSTVHKLYLEALTEDVLQYLTEAITRLCCKNDDRFFRSILPELKNYPYDNNPNKWRQIVLREGNLSRPDASDRMNKALLRMNLLHKELESHSNIRKRVSNQLHSWINTLVPYFVSHQDAEDKLVHAIVGWFKSGEMSIEHYEMFRMLSIIGHSSLFRVMKIALMVDENENEHCAKYVRALEGVKQGRDLLGPETVEKLKRILVTMTTVVKKEKNDRTGIVLQLSGAVMFLSHLKKLIDYGPIPQLYQVDIHSAFVLVLDCDLGEPQWHGRNLCIVSEKIIVSKRIIIRVSGRGHNKKLRDSATSGSKPGEKGSDGVDGKAGESSGNVLILTNDFRNSSSLTILLNGGDGEGGQNGGKGADGIEGDGVTLKEFNDTLVPYTRLTFDMWKTFNEFRPDIKIWRECPVRRHDPKKEYIYEEYYEQKEKRGRCIEWCISAGRRWPITGYELYFWMKGTPGSAGSQGGLNGLGGEGGRSGECKILSLNTGSALYNLTVNQKKTGDDGDHGEIGRCGNPGQHGNHIAYIDRSFFTNRGGYYGSGEKSVIHKTMCSTSEEFTRLNGYLKHVKNDPECYVKFSITTNEITNSENTNKGRTDENRAQASKALHKESVNPQVARDEFAELCSTEEHQFVASIAVVQKPVFESTHVTVQQDERERVGEQISILRQFEENGLIATQTIDRESELMTNVVNEMRRLLSHNAPLIEHIAFWQNVFDVKFDAAQHLRRLFIYLRRLVNKLDETRIRRAFRSNNYLSNGMNYEEVTNFRRQLPKKLDEKISLSGIDSTFKNVTNVSEDIEIIDNEIVDVRKVDDQSFEKTQLASNESQQLGRFFNMVNLKHAEKKLLMVLYEVYKYLKSHRSLFHRFQQKDLDWCDKGKVLEHFKVHFDENSEVPASSQEHGHRESSKKSSWKQKFSFNSKSNAIKKFMENDGSFAFADIAALREREASEMNGAFKELNAIASEEPQILSRVSLIEQFFGSTNRLQDSSMNLIFLYFSAEKILKFTMTVYRFCHLDELLIPKNFENKTQPPHRVDDFVQLIKEKDYIPSFTERFYKFMVRKRMECSAYRQFVADQRKTNIKLFVANGFGSMRLVEELNPWCEKSVKLLITPSGDVFAIEADLQLRRLRATFNSFRINIPLPQSSREPVLTSFFPHADATIVDEWCNALIVTTGSDMLLRLLRKLFELRGCWLNVYDLQFMINSTIELCLNYGLKMETVCGRILSKDGCILNKWLGMRIMFKLRSTFSPTFEDQIVVKDSYLSNLLSYKLHEAEFNEETALSLVHMLAHPKDLSSNLYTSKLDKWIEEARLRRWEQFDHFFKTYGPTGYYWVLLEGVNTERTREASRVLRAIVNDLKKNTFSMAPNFIALVTNLTLCKEIHLTGDVVLKLTGVMKQASQILKNKSEHECMVSLMKNEDFRSVVPSSTRNVKDLVDLIIKSEIDDVKKEKRRKCLSKIQDLLSSRIMMSDGSLAVLSKIDQVFADKRNIRLWDTQKLAILSAFHSKDNLLSQANTGEGKTNIITALAIMRVLMNKNKSATVDIISSSPVLAKRDSEEMREIYEAFDIKVAHNCDEDIEKREIAYKCHVVYGDIAHFQRDYLIHYFHKKNVLGNRANVSTSNVIADEVDSILLDNGNNTLYLQHYVPGLELLDSLFVFIHKTMYVSNDEDSSERICTASELKRKVLVDLFGVVSRKDIFQMLSGGNMRHAKKITWNVWRLMRNNNIVDSLGCLKQCSREERNEFVRKLELECGKTTGSQVLAMLSILRQRRREIILPEYLKPFILQHLDEFIESALRSTTMKNQNEYVVDFDRSGHNTNLHPGITIVDKGTGTDLLSSHWSEGLHQFLQIKHGCFQSPLSLKAVFVSNVSFLKKSYSKLNGFSGTLGSTEESKSLAELYGADLMRIPTSKPKIFMEEVPLLAETDEKWIQLIYDDVCAKVMDHRVVLLICQSIDEVELLDSGLRKLYNQKRPSFEKVIACFQNIQVYKRDSEKVEFSDGVPASRLIISTNLAGRGTDIKLEPLVVENMGLHVIISFLPENNRIEEQAFGRASRKGEPGFGRIIARSTEANDTSKIFKLKEHRNNDEARRMRSLKDIYDFRTSVEEKCLQKFEEHCQHITRDALSTADEQSMSASRIIYFALLDEWSLWLDSKAKAIKHCEISKKEADKEDIISSVGLFLADHPLPKKLDDDHEVEESAKWIRFPHPLLNLARLFIRKNQPEKAEHYLNKVISQFPEFAAEVCYYKAIIAHSKIHKTNFGFKYVNNFAEYLSISTQMVHDDYIEINPKFVKKAYYFFELARSKFSARISKHKEMTHIVSESQQNAGNIVSRGFIAQQEDSVSVLECVMSNIDDFIGHIAKVEHFRLESEEEYLAELHYVEALRASIISPNVLASHISPQQLQTIVGRYRMSYSYIETRIRKIRENFDGKMITRGVLNDTIKMPSSVGCWESLKRAGAFREQHFFVAIKKDYVSRMSFMNLFKKSEMPKGPFLLRNSMKSLDEFDLFEFSADAKSVADDRKLKTEFYNWETAGILHTERAGIIDPVGLARIEYLDEFHYLTNAIVAEELGVAGAMAQWILNKLSTDGIIKKANEEEITEGNECKYVLVDKMDCKMFPENIREDICELLVRNSSYGIALKTLKCSIQEEVEGKTVMHRIILDDSYEGLHNDMVNCGILLPSRYTTTLTEVYAPKIKGLSLASIGDRVMNPRKLLETPDSQKTHLIPAELYERLENLAPKMEKCFSCLMSTACYFQESRVRANEEVCQIFTSSGLGQIAILHKPNPWNPLRYISHKKLSYALTVIWLAPFTIVLIGVAAVVGCMLVMMALTEKKRVNSKSFDRQKEYRQLRQYHEIAMKVEEESEETLKKSKMIRRDLQSLCDKMASIFMDHLVVTNNTEDVARTRSQLLEYCKNFKHVSILRDGIYRWLSVHMWQELNFYKNDGNLSTNSYEVPSEIYAFCVMVVKDFEESCIQNSSQNNQASSSIARKLNYDRFLQSRPLEADNNSLTTVLKEALRRAVEPIVDDAVRDLLIPACQAYETLKDELDDRSVQQRSSKTRHFARRLRNRNNMEDKDVWAMDLHNVLLRVCFKEPRIPVLHHMVRYNYPCSPHCAEKLFDAAHRILIDNDPKVVGFVVNLKRFETTIFCYAMTKMELGDSGSVVHVNIGLENDTFYVHETETRNEREHHLGLFEALNSTNHRFLEAFNTSPEEFVDILLTKLDQGASDGWKKEISWNGLEEYYCAVAI